MAEKVALKIEKVQNFTKISVSIFQVEPQIPISWDIRNLFQLMVPVRSRKFKCFQISCGSVKKSSKNIFETFFCTVTQFLCFCSSCVETLENKLSNQLISLLQKQFTSSLSLYRLLKCFSFLCTQICNIQF